MHNSIRTKLISSWVVSLTSLVDKYRCQCECGPTFRILRNDNASFKSIACCCFVDIPHTKLQDESREVVGGGTSQTCQSHPQITPILAVRLTYYIEDWQCCYKKKISKCSIILWLQLGANYNDLGLGPWQAYMTGV